MRNRYRMWWLGLVVGSVFTVPAEAELLGRLPATPGGTDYRAAYDDVLDITWVTDAALSGPARAGRTWPDIVTWAEGLELGGADDWRLASMSVSAGVPTGRTDSVVDCETETELACRDNELGYMYYYNLASVGSGYFGDDKTGTQTVGDVTLTNIRDFYWSGTEIELDGAWDFLFYNGNNSYASKASPTAGWAVRDGDIGFIPMPSTAVEAASFPSNRTVQVGSPASAIATVTNTGNTTATDCNIAVAPQTSVPADFAYVSADASYVPEGTPNTPVDIAPEGSQNFIFAFTPTEPIDPINVELNYDCTNTDPAPITWGLNTLALSATTTAEADILALATTPTGDGILNLPGVNGSNAFSVATVNAGVTDTLDVTPIPLVNTLPVVLSICETDPGTGACLSAPASKVTSTIDSGAMPTYSVFVTGTGTVPFDPATNRIIVLFTTFVTVRGLTSVAVQTQ